MKTNRGFSLLEISIVIFVMGLTITALLQMFDFSHLRYRAIAKGWQERAMMAEIRIWTRNRIISSDLENINVQALNKAVKIPSGFLISDLSIVKQENNLIFIRIEYADDRNRNGIAEKNEISSRLFCFMRRAV